MKAYLFVLVGLIVVCIGAAFVGKAASQAKPAIDDTVATGWYKIVYFPVNQPHCSEDLLPSICCDEAYVSAAAVDSACMTSTTRLVRVQRSPFSPGSCCGCDHEFCVQITNTTQRVNALPPGACILRVLECYNDCSDCLADLP